MQYSDTLTKEKAIQFRSGNPFWIVTNEDCSGPIPRDKIQFDLHSFDFLFDGKEQKGALLFDDENEAMMRSLSNKIKNIDSAASDFKNGVNLVFWKKYVDEVFEESYGGYLKNGDFSEKEKDRIKVLFLKNQASMALLRKRQELYSKMLQYSMKSRKLLPDFNINKVLENFDSFSKSDWSVIGAFDYSRLYVEASRLIEGIFIKILTEGGCLMESRLFQSGDSKEILDWIKKSYFKLCFEFSEMKEMGFNRFIDRNYILEMNHIEYDESRVRRKEIMIRHSEEEIFIDVRVSGLPGVMKTVYEKKTRGSIVEEAKRLLIRESFDKEYPLPPKVMEDVKRLYSREYPDFFKSCVMKNILDMQIEGVRQEMTSLINDDEINEEKIASLTKELSQALKKREEMEE